MRRLNVKFLVGALVVVALLGAGVYGAHRLQVRRRTDDLMRLARQAEEKGDIGRARELLERYAGFRPRDAEAMARYGLLLRGQAKTHNESLRAFLVLEQALRLDAGRRDVRREAVDLAMGDALRRYADARAHLDVLLTAAPDDGELEDLYGQALEKDRKYPEAEGWYRKAIKHAPARVEAYVRLAALRRDHLDDPDGADRAMDAREDKDGVVVANGKSSRAYLERARYRRAHQIEGADRDVARALELGPEEVDVLREAAGSASARGRLDEARRHLARAQELAPKDAGLREAMAGVEAKAGRPGEAEAQLRRGLEAGPAPEVRTRLLWSLANLLIDEHKHDEAREAIGRLAEDKEKARPGLTDYLEARILVDQGKWGRAADKLETARPPLADAPALAYPVDLLLGLCYERLGDGERRLAAYRSAVKLDVRDRRGRLGLAAALEAAGDLEAATEEYRGLAAEAPEAAIALARLQFVRAMRQPAPRRDWRPVDQALDGAAKASPDAIEVPVLRAESLVARGRVPEARAALTEAAGRHPDRVDLRVALAALAGREGGPEAVLAGLDRAEEALGDRVEIRLARAGYWAGRGGADAPGALAKLEEGLDRFPEADRRRLLRDLAGARLRIGDDAGARRLLDRLVESQPGDLTAQLARFDLALRAGDEVAMERVAGELKDLEGEPRGALWRYMKARSLLQRVDKKGPGAGDRESLAEARRLLTEAGSLRPGLGQVPLSLAEIDDRDGKPEDALKGYLRAIELGIREPAALRRTFQLLYRARRTTEADELARKVVGQGGAAAADPFLLKVAAEATLRGRDPGRALDLAQKSVAADSKDYRDHLWLGQILWASGKADEAGQALRRAVELGGRAPETWVALVRYLAGTGRKQQAGEAIERARRELPADQAAPTLARCYTLVGDSGRAGEQYRRALADHPDDAGLLRDAALYDLNAGRTPEGIALLERIVGLGDRAPEDVAWARRMQALVLASGRTREGLDRARGLLGIDKDPARYRPSGRETDEDLRVAAYVLNFHRGPAARQAAIRALEPLDRRESAQPRDRFLLAELYEAEGDWVKAGGLMLGVLAEDEGNPAFLGGYVRGLIAHGQADEARPWLAKLEKLRPGDLQTAELRARYLKADGQGGKAATLLTGYARGHADQAGQVADLLEKIGEDAAAETLYRQVAARAARPLDALALADFLGRHGRTEEALALCDKAWSSCPPNPVALVSVTALHAARPDGATIDRVGRSIEAAIRKGPETAELLFQLANVRSLQRRYDEAVKLYRRAATMDEGNVGPLNNLAWLVALKDGNGAEALELVNRAIELGEANADLLDTRAVAYLALDRAAEAIADLKRAAALEPSSAPIYFHLARAYQRDRRTDAAVEALRKAESLGLKADSLGPLERPSYDRIVAQLGRK